jgi:hypothetical protein
MSVQTSDDQARAVPVLVVGDWLVDEYWVAGKHRSSTSTRTGPNHSRALQTAGSSVRSLCGAGQVATVLHQAEHHGQRVFDLSGIGIWHAEDTQALTEMLDPETSIGRTPHRLTENARTVSPEECPLYSLATNTGVVVGTTRIIRTYESVEQHIKIVQRLDWEVTLTATQHRKMRRGLRSVLAKRFENRGVEHIVVKDLLKGGVDPTLIRALRDRFRKAYWYISSKEWDPPWVKDLPPGRVKLILIPPKSAQRALTKEAISAHWLVEGVPSKEAGDAITMLGKRFPMARVVVLPDEFRIIAYEPSSPEDKAQGCVSSEPRVRETTTAMASIFFASVVAHIATAEMRMKKSSPVRPDLQSALQESLMFTRRWQTIERQRLSSYDWRPQPEQILSIHDHGLRGNWREVKWDESKAQWNAAFSDLGLVTDHRRKEFQLWRGMTELSNYVACNPTKRQALNTIIRAGRALRDTEPVERRQKSFLIVDNPGSGKSYLIECLRRELGFTLMHFNVTRIESKNEIFKFLEDVSRAQRGLRDPVLIFVDEIDAKVGPREIYDAFLEPLEDGRFGGFGELDPALWIFAETKNPSQFQKSKIIKASDFVSRLSDPIFDFRLSSRRGSDIARVEQVYVGVACLLKRFPEITQISRRVLRAFRSLKAATPREIRRFVSEFEEVQLSRVMVHNLPRGDWEKRFVVPDIYVPDNEHDLVPIRVHPAR